LHLDPDLLVLLVEREETGHLLRAGDDGLEGTRLRDRRCGLRRAGKRRRHGDRRLRRDGGRCRLGRRGLRCRRGRGALRGRTEGEGKRERAERAAEMHGHGVSLVSKVTIAPRRLCGSARVISTSANWPARRGWPAKFTTRLHSVLPASSLPSFFERPSTSTRWRVPTSAFEYSY